MESSSLKRLAVLMATVFVDMIGYLIVLPILPFYAEKLGARAVVITAMISCFFLAQLLTAPLWGRLSDRYGRRPVLLAGLASSAVAFALFGLADSIFLLFVVRLIQGAGGATTGVVQAYVSDSVPPDDRAKALGWITAATSAGVMIGPLIGSFATYFGPSGPGFVAAGLCTLNALSAWRWLPESNRRDGAAERPRRPVSDAVFEVLKHPMAPVSSLIWIYTVGMLAFMGMNGVLALYLGAAYGVTERTIGWLYSYVGGVGLVMRAVLLGPTVRRFGEIGVTRMGATSLALGLAALPLPAMLPLARPTQIVLLALAALFVPVGTALLFPATTALVSRRTIQGETGQTMGVQQSFGSVARLVGPVLAGLAFEVDNRYPFWAASALMLATGFLTSRLRGDAPAVEGKEGMASAEAG